jgi:hypothetical protein
MTVIRNYLIDSSGPRKMGYNATLKATLVTFELMDFRKIIIVCCEKQNSLGEILS